MKSLFHLAYHVTNLDEARQFYGGVLGCPEGRSTDTWVDFNFFGHQISLHLGEPFKTTNTGKVVCDSTRWVTLPSNSFSMPWRPCEPMMIRSAASGRVKLV